MHAEANKGLQGTHGFPQSKSDQKIQELHARKTQMENLKLVVALDKCVDSGSDQGEARKHTHVWLERSVLE
jgi:hypothetical protein